MRKIWLLVLLAFSSLVDQAAAAEYGKRRAGTVEASLASVLGDPGKFSEKRVSVWGVVGGYREATFLFLTHDHARWRDMSSAVQIEPQPDLTSLRLGSPAWKKLYASAVLMEGTLKAEKFDSNRWKLFLVIDYVFIPEDDRQTGRNPKENASNARPEATKE